jgi:hypothetical protein
MTTNDGGGLRIDQFMWAWQIHFRLGVESRLERALRSIGAHLDPSVFLVGITEREGARHSICIEPESGPVQPEHLVGLFELADDLYHDDPDSRIWTLTQASMNGASGGCIARRVVEQ